jgi:hypothetical protein
MVIIMKLDLSCDLGSLKQEKIFSSVILVGNGSLCPNWPDAKILALKLFLNISTVPFYWQTLK